MCKKSVSQIWPRLKAVCLCCESGSDSTLLSLTRLTKRSLQFDKLDPESVKWKSVALFFNLRQTCQCLFLSPKLYVSYILHFSTSTFLFIIVLMSQYVFTYIIYIYICSLHISINSRIHSVSIQHISYIHI